jgi:protease I
VDESELTEPVEALKGAGASVDIISPDGKPIQAFKHYDKSDLIPADRSLKDCTADEYDAVLLPGGALNADFMRMQPANQEFLRRMDRGGKPLAVICHAP